MTRPKTSPIWTGCSDEEFKNLVKNSSLTSEILKYFGLLNKGCNYRTVRQRIADLGIDDSHILRGVGCTKGKITGCKKKQPLDEILTEHSSFDRSHLKTRLIKEGILENKCNSCGCFDTWNNKPLVLQLEHKNGIFNDNRLENLCLLCPNCHSQTKTFAGKNNKPRDRSDEDVCSCGNKKHRYSKQCSVCYHKTRRKSF